MSDRYPILRRTAGAVEATIGATLAFLGVPLVNTLFDLDPEGSVATYVTLGTLGAFITGDGLLRGLTGQSLIGKRRG